MVGGDAPLRVVPGWFVPDAGVSNREGARPKRHPDTGSTLRLVKPELSAIVGDFAAAVMAVDATRPKHPKYTEGIGPFEEEQVNRFVLEYLSPSKTGKYGRHDTEIEYKDRRGWKRFCDLAFGMGPDWDWLIETKLFRMKRSNGDVEIDALDSVASAVKDGCKLADSVLVGRKAILVYGYDYAEFPLADLIDAFEFLARSHIELRPRESASFDGLVHRYHQRGMIVGWEVLGRR